MSKAPSPFKQATVCHEFQFDLILAKLELVLANPLATVSVTIAVGTQKFSTLQRPKASKETILKETVSLPKTFLYEDPKKGFQEKMATLEVFLNNSQVSNVIGMLKLDLANYVRSKGEKLELLALQKSAQYQGKILLGVNAIPVEPGEEDDSGSQINTKNNMSALEPNDSVSQRDNSEVGGKTAGTKRSVTPNLRATKNPATDKLMHMVDRVIAKNVDAKAEESKENGGRKSALQIKNVLASRQERKLVSLFEPVLNKTNDVIKEYSNDEKAKIEKVLSTMKSEKESAESRVHEYEKVATERSKEFELWKSRCQEMEKENYRLRLENDELKLSLQKEKSVINDLMKGEVDKLEILRKNDVSASEKQVDELKKEIERLLQEKFALEKALSQQKKLTEEVNNKLVVQIDESAALKREQANQNEYIAKKERQIKTLIEEINRGKEKGTAENFVQQTEKVRLLEEELKSTDDQVAELKRTIVEKTSALSETKINLEKALKENAWQKNEIQTLNDKLGNIEKIMEIKDENLKQVEELQLRYIKSKQNLADILNLAFEANVPHLVEEIDRLISP